MQWANALSERESISGALADVIAAIAAPHPPNLVLVFVSGRHGASLDAFAEGLKAAFPGACVVGGIGRGVIGGGREIEDQTAISVTAGWLPGVTLHPFALEAAEAWSVEQWRSVVAAERGILVLADPYSIALASYLPTLRDAFPGVPVLGGLAGAAKGARLVVDGEARTVGAVGVGLSGAVRVTSCLAQGCRPLGPPMFVTRCMGNRILEFDGRGAADVLREVYESLDPEDRALFERSLFVGVQMREQIEYAQGDFLVRNVVGLVGEPRALAVGFLPERFDVVQLHVRDRVSARADVVRVLEATEAKPSGALLVSCVGRGRGLFEEDDHDSLRFRERFGDVPIGGFFANGEIGPVQGQTFVHGYTSVFALFESA